MKVIGGLIHVPQSKHYSGNHLKSQVIHLQTATKSAFFEKVPTLPHSSTPNSCNGIYRPMGSNGHLRE